MMKTSDSPRRIYTRNGITCACFEGKLFGAGSDSTIDPRFPVILEKLPSDGKRAAVKVTQKRAHAKTIVETWRTVTMPKRGE